MKKLLYTLFIVSSLALFFGCGNKPDSNNNNQITPPADNPSDNDNDNKNDEDNDSEDENVTIYKIDAGTTTALENHGWYIAAISLSDFPNETIDIDFSAKMKVENKGEEKSLSWQINGVDADGNAAYPSVASGSFATGTSDWITVTGNKTGIILGQYSSLYLSSYGITPENFIIYVKELSVTVKGTSTKVYTEIPESTGITTENKTDTPTGNSSNNWLSNDVPGLYDTYKDQFDYIGIAAEYGNFGISCFGDKYTGTYTANGYWGTPSELYYEEVQKGVAKHANSITLGNEMKPQFLLQWWTGDGSSQTMVNFTASNGKTIKVPNQLNGENLIYATLNVAEKMGVQMRGHVLTWHSQTPDGFFAEGYSPTYSDSTKNTITNLVDAETMTARHEWYIKTVLKCVENWESANGYGPGNHIIWAWDVVNEAMADDAGKTYTGDSQNWLRGSTAGTENKSPDNGGGSRWYQIYGNEEFIVNAFRFANAYAPSDVKLCYNDYNEYMEYNAGWKTSAIEHIATVVKAGEAKTVNGKSVAPRLDVIAMQSHVGTSWPGVEGYEAALKRFLALGCDVHVSELDFSAATAAEAKTAYADYFTMFQKYGKKSSGANKITNVTIWGINNESSWINPSSAGGKKTYPLLFNLDNKVSTNVKEVTYDTGVETLQQYDIGDTYNANDSFWAVINAHQ